MSQPDTTAPPSQKPALGMMRVFVGCVDENGKADSIVVDISADEWLMLTVKQMTSSVLVPAYKALRKHA